MFVPRFDYNSLKKLRQNEERKALAKWQSQANQIPQRRTARKPSTTAFLGLANTKDWRTKDTIQAHAWFQVATNCIL